MWVLQGSGVASTLFLCWAWDVMVRAGPALGPLSSSPGGGTLPARLSSGSWGPLLAQLNQQAH